MKGELELPGEHMATDNTMMSVSGQHALQDMVELQMYIVAQAQQKPWPLFSRGVRHLPGRGKPYCNPVESSASKELWERGFIEPTSSLTFIVSKSGYEFYTQELKLQLA
jgi:hypothetical protein